MEDFYEFDRNARQALAKFPVNVGTFYGYRETATVTGNMRFYVSVKGQGLPADGLTVGRICPSDAVKGMVSRLKQYQEDQHRINDARDRARRQQPLTTNS